MATSVVPDLIDALLALARSGAVAIVPDSNVFDGVGVTQDPGNFLMVGVEDPDMEGMAFAADARQEWSGVGTGAPRDEEGDVTCVAVAWNGDGDAKAARDAAYAIAAALEDALRANPSLGVSSLLWTGFGSSSQLSQAQGEGGASSILIFRIHFRARI